MKRRVSNHRRLLKLQRQIFQSLEAEVESIFGRPPEAIGKYEREYLADFRSSEQRARLGQIPKRELLQAVRRAEVVFVADFHTFPQAQRTMLRLLRETAAKPRPGLALGLELVSTDQQDALDAFQAGRIGLVEFHRAVGYRKNWGFPWENYAPLFAWAREHSVRLIALNRPHHPDRSRAPASRRAARLALAMGAGSGRGLAAAPNELHERDQWAAAVIADYFLQSEAQGEEPRLFVLYGELHVGSRHLPARLRDASARHLGRTLGTVTIHQDRDSLFWKLAEKGKELETEILRLSRDSFCVFSGTPWARLMSLIAWAEGDSENPEGFETRLRATGQDEGSRRSQADYLSLMRSDASAIARFLSLPTPSFESLGAYTIDEADILESARVRHAFTVQERALIRFHVMHSIRIYLPRICVAYLANPSFNSLSEMAAIHILRTFSGDSRLFDGTDESLFRRIIEHAFGFFGSLVLNPRRKCDHVADHEHRAESLLAGARRRSATAREAFPGELEARRLAVRVLRTRPLRLAGLRLMGRSRRPSVRELTSAMMAARYVGEVLGKRLHRAALGESIALGKVIELCLEPLTEAGDSYRARYLRLAQLLAPAALPRSKRSAL